MKVLKEKTYKLCSYSELSSCTRPVKEKEQRSIDGFSTPHTRDTAKPQTYRQHFKVAFYYSLKMIWYALGGIVHAILPEIKCLQFATSTFLFKAVRFLAYSGRHDDEINEVFGEEWVAFVKKQRESH